MAALPVGPLPVRSRSRSQAQLRLVQPPASPCTLRPFDFERECPPPPRPVRARPEPAPRPPAPAHRRRTASRGAALIAARRTRPGLVRRSVPGALTLAVLAGAWFGAGALVGLRPSATPGVRAPGASLVAGATYVVQPGDTLWSIALRLDPAGDPRPVVDELSSELGGAPLQPGEHLVLP
jgi:LysM domain